MRLLTDRTTRGTSFPSSFWYLFAGTLINRIGAFVLPFLTLFLTTGLDYPPAQAAVVVGAYGGGSLVASFMGGLLADRIGRRGTILLSMGGGAFAMATVPFVKGLPALIVAVAVLGVLSELYRPAVAAAVADLVPDEHRARAFALIYWATNLGFAVAPVMAGIVATHSFRLLFLVNAIAMVSYASLVAARVPETRPAAGPEHGNRPPLPVALKDWRLVAWTGLYLMLACIFYQGFTTLPLSMAAKGYAPRVFGTTIALNGMLIVLFTLGAVPILRKYRPGHVMVVAAVLIGCGFGLTGLATNIPGYAFSILVWTLGEIAMAPTAPTIVARLAPTHLRGAYQGIFHVGWGGGALLGPSIGGLVFQTMGETVLWSACAVLGFVAATGYALLARVLPRWQANVAAAPQPAVNSAAVNPFDTP